jgi:hypothetical protein
MKIYGNITRKDNGISVEIKDFGTGTKLNYTARRHSLGVGIIVVILQLFLLQFHNPYRISCGSVENNLFYKHFADNWGGGNHYRTSWSRDTLTTTFFEVTFSMNL